MSDQDNFKIARDFIAAYDNKNWEKYSSFTTNDFVYDEKATQRRIEGTGQMIESFQGWAKAFPDSKCKITNCFGNNDFVAMEIVWTGKHTGPLTTPFGTFAPTNKSFNLCSAYFMNFKNGKMKEAHQYFDFNDLQRQLGLNNNKR